MSFFDTLKKDVAAFDNVVIRDEQAVKQWSEQLFGKAKSDQFIANAVAVAETELGDAAKKAVILVQSKLGDAIAGSVKLSTASSIVKAIGTALGQNWSSSAINAAIEQFVPFVASLAVKAAAAGLIG